MSKRKLIITQNLNEALLEKVKELVPDWQVITGRSPDIWKDHLTDAEVIAGWKASMSESIEVSDVKWIQTWSAGVNSLPLESLKQRNVQITTANGVHAFPISETIFGFMLALTRKIDTYMQQQLAKSWRPATKHQEIHEKTIGIIGVGKIGKETAKIAKAFGMTVLGMRHSGKAEEYVDEMFTQERLADLLPRCDFIVVTLPLTAETENMFGKYEFELMKPSAFFINIGRGKLVNQRELIQALLDKQIAGAGLDVFETEPLPETNPLWEMDNVMITPHTSGDTELYDQRLILDIFIPNLKEYLNGKAPSTNLLDYNKGY
ncbi:D-2-hydroxyacid dehydrogenase [Peribacillus muralis]|uniref:D-2-hydroxyacid dehydrogenase n=1 Tax=Peribacillus muralis TaxID=264697 RepID=UPI001F4E6B74|nr:D-2-hydroxyacid dehydrogenase [Peribacillus muralis]MCK1993309.1 D-2-hydroxyacid dehydrogenase [Peribacillus muralis]MCK2014403.1 D-2-hydroxyacid dehydrogenase [Peribacillus muralis]